MHILIAEDDAFLARGLKTALTQHGFIVDWVAEGDLVLVSLKDNKFDALILDLNLPKLSGLEILKEIRTSKIDVPVLILTAKNSLADKLTCFDNGADDYLTKPFEIKELMARLRAIHRRRHGLTRSKIDFNGFTIDVTNQQVFRENQSMELSVKEFAVFLKLFENLGEIVSRRRLEENLYDWDNIIESNAVEVYIHHIRKKLGKDIIKTMRGIGYLIEE